MNPIASKKRRLLAVYIDYLLFAAVAAPVVWFLGRAGYEVHWAVMFFAFAIVESVGLKWARTTPGTRALSIVEHEGKPTVAARVKETERWWTMLLGVSLILEGSKNLVRFTEGLPPLPVFGSENDLGAFAVTALLGAGNIIAGVLILRCRVAGPLLGLGVGAAWASVLALTWDQLDEWGFRRVSIQRELRGQTAVTAEDFEALGGMFQVFAVSALVIGAVLLVLAYVRFRRGATDR
ncbi:MAG: hypothetical protein AAF500_18985 [Myxococcota bacterium]